MNAIVKADIPEAQTIDILRNTFYIGAKVESVRLVLGYCRAQGLDPMLRPVHIVPMWNAAAKCMVDTVMPGIGLYRILAARSGQYAGKLEPEFGPEVTDDLGGVSVRYPAWCKVTVYRMVDGQARGFTAMERWLENYATAKRDTDAPNAMWKRRAYGQLAKVAEAQALRMAFPEHNGGYTAEEMEGKGDYIETTAAPASRPEPSPESPQKRPQAAAAAAPVPTIEDDVEAFKLDVDACSSQDELEQLTAEQGTVQWRAKVAKLRPDLAEALNEHVRMRLELVAGWDGISNDAPGEMPA